jgi:hypothetical protein
MKSRMLALLAVAGLIALPSSAQNMKAGLWEMTNKMQTSDGKLEKAMADMQKQMASMPAEQRKMMEDMMAKQGVQMGAPGGPMTVKLCMSKEMIAKGMLPTQQQGDCTSNRSPMVGNTVHMTFKCTNPPSSGEGDMVFQSDSAYSMKMLVEHTQAGKKETMTMDGNAKWLGSDCGAIKPFDMMRPAK